MLYLQAEDKAGNQSEYAVRTFCIDKADPVLTVDELQSTETKFFSESSLEITGSATDSHGIDYILIMNGTEELTRIDGSELGEDGSWTASVGLEPDTGIRGMTITAYDRAGRQSATEARSIYRDTKAPVLTVSTDLSGITENIGNGLEVRGTVSDGAGSGAARVYYTVTPKGGAASAEMEAVLEVVAKHKYFSE